MKQTLLFYLLLLSAGTVLAQSVPNGTFENWNTTSYEELNGWTTSNSECLSQIGMANVTKVTGFSSASAIRMETMAVGTDTIPGYIYNTHGDPLDAEGGVPFTQNPTAITGFYRYNLAGNDTAILVVIFKKNGNPISLDVFKIRGTGSQPTFTSFSFPISLPMTPDSVIIATSCSNALNDEMVAGSWMELDSLKFTGPSVTQSVPNATFENWTAMSFDLPQGWYLNSQSGLSRTTDKYTGSYAVKLVTQDMGGGFIEPAAITTGQPGSANAGRPYTLMTDTFTGYYKYIPAVGNDSASIYINLSNMGAPVGGMNRKLGAAANYTYFEIPFTAFSAPDSIRIDIQSSDWSTIPSIGGSTLYIDKIQLKSQPLGIAGISGKGSFMAYPNPVHDMLKIKMPGNGAVGIVLADVMGKEIMHNEYQVHTGEIITIPVTQLPAGVYYYNIRTGGEVFSNKFVKE